MTYKLRCLPNKLIEDNGKEVRFLLSRYIIRKIKAGGNYFILSLKDERGRAIKSLGHFEIKEVTRKRRKFGGSGGTHRECILKRWVD